MSRLIRAIRGSVSVEEARVISSRLRRVVPSDSRRLIERKLYYPYFWFLLRYSTKAILGTPSLRVSCLIDSRTRLGATTDPFELDSLLVADEDVMPGLLLEGEAFRLAKRYAGHVVKSKRKALLAENCDVLLRLPVYKPFWVIEASEENSVPGIVDATNGGFHPLNV